MITGEAKAAHFKLVPKINLATSSILATSPNARSYEGSLLVPCAVAPEASLMVSTELRAALGDHLQDWYPVGIDSVERILFSLKLQGILWTETVLDPCKPHLYITSHVTSLARLQ